MRTETFIAVLFFAISIGLSPAAGEPILRVRGDYSYPPFEYLNKDGEPEGYNTDIMQAVARVMNMDIRISLGPWEEVRRELERGDIDILMGMYRTPERDRLVDFSISHLLVSYGIFVRGDSPIMPINDIRGKEIIVQKDDLGHDFVRENRISDRLILKRNWVDTLHSLDRGEGDCAIVSRLQGMRLIRELGLKNIGPTGPPLLQRGYCIAVPAGREELLAKINEGLFILRATGEYAAIYEKWFGIYDEKPLKHYIKYILWILIPLLMTAAAGYVWSWSLKKQVIVRTRALKESEEKFRLIAEQTMLGIIIIQDGMVRYVNNAVAEMNEYMAEEMLAWEAESYMQTVHPEDSEKVLEHFRKTGMKGNNGSVIDEWRIITRTGKIKWIAVYSRTVQYGGRPADLSAVVDITENRLMMERMVQNEKMATVGNLAAGMAHELNNPLGIVLQGLQTAMSRLDPSMAANRRAAMECGTTIEAINEYMTNRKIDHYFRGIIEAGERASDIIISLLQFTRKNDLRRNGENINLLIESSIELLSSDYSFNDGHDFRKVEIIRRYEETLPLLSCVKTEIQHVFINILRNAAQALPEANDEGFQPRIHINTGLDGSQIRIAVSDNGPGMDRETIRNVFDPFFTTKAVGAGTGLGLSVSYFIVTEKHRGTLHVESEPGKGSTFVIMLPL